MQDARVPTGLSRFFSSQERIRYLEDTPLAEMDATLLAEWNLNPAAAAQPLPKIFVPIRQAVALTQKAAAEITEIRRRLEAYADAGSRPAFSPSNGFPAMSGNDVEAELERAQAAGERTEKQLDALLPQLQACLSADRASANAVCPVSGATPLHVCASAGLEAFARVLLEHGAPRTTLDALGLTAAQHARLFDHDPMADLIETE